MEKPSIKRLLNIEHYIALSEECADYPVSFLQGSLLDTGQPLLAIAEPP